jgi:redox-sensing transcriptional repressor
MDSDQIPDIVVGRLPRYLQALQRMAEDGKISTSSQELGDRLGISAAQIRKDLSQFGEFGKQGTGYAIPFLIDQLETILKIKRFWDIVLIGAGDLGHAIEHYQGFSNRGFRIAMVFDNDTSKIGTKINHYIVQDIANLEKMVHEAGIKVAMLTVPASAAQPVCQTLVKAGIKAILSYAPTPLNLPDDIHVEYIDPLIQLQHMTYYLG